MNGCATCPGHVDLGFSELLLEIKDKGSFEADDLVLSIVEELDLHQLGQDRRDLLEEVAFAFQERFQFRSELWEVEQAEVDLLNVLPTHLAQLIRIYLRTLGHEEVLEVKNSNRKVHIQLSNRLRPKVLDQDLQVAPDLLNAIFTFLK